MSGGTAPYHGTEKYIKAGMGLRGTLEPFNQYHLPSLSLVTIIATNFLLEYLKPKAPRIKIPSGLIVTYLCHSVFRNFCPIQSSLCP